MGANGKPDGAYWGRIFEGAGPPPHRKGWSLYDDLWNEIMLRLEKTPQGWLHIPVDSPSDVERLRSALDNRAQKAGGTVIIKSTRKEKMIYVTRGPNWAKRDAGRLAHIEADPADTPNIPKPSATENGKRRPGRPRKSNEIQAEVHDFD